MNCFKKKEIEELEIVWELAISFEKDYACKTFKSEKEAKRELIRIKNSRQKWIEFDNGFIQKSKITYMWIINYKVRNDEKT